MAEASSEHSLASEEGKKKAESLFSKKFQEYLTRKTSAANITPEKPVWPPTLVRDYSPSSTDTTASESSRKSGKKSRKKVKENSSHWDFHYAFRNRLTQCSLLKSDSEVAPPEDLKPLLLNMTILLQELKRPNSEQEDLCNLISKITILVTEFIRRPLRKIQEGEKGEYMKKVEKTIEAMMNLLEDYKNVSNLDSDNSVRELKRHEKEITNRNHQIAQVKKRLSENVWKTESKTKDINVRVRRSILVNEKLKSDIRFNQTQVKKYKKLMLEREWVKHKLETELTHLKKKISKSDLSEVEISEKQTESSEPTLKAETKNKSVKMKKGKESKKPLKK